MAISSKQIIAAASQSPQPFTPSHRHQAVTAATSARFHRIAGPESSLNDGKKSTVRSYFRFSNFFNIATQSTSTIPAVLVAISGSARTAISA